MRLQKISVFINRNFGLEIERDEDVRVCLAVESGSRAWGFPSVDSDYDVRFFYLRRREWYLSIDGEEHRDVIERPLVGILDVSGWDLRKALRLFRKSNPPLLEWLQSPIIYRESGTVAERLRALVPTFYSPQAGFRHYLHMARNNFREYLHGDVVWRKKYLYVLRPLLAMLWIERGLGPVPIEFPRLLQVVDDQSVRRAIDMLVEAKRAGRELDRGPRILSVSDFVERELSRLESLEPARQAGSSLQLEELNVLFRASLDEAWSRQPV